MLVIEKLWRISFYHGMLSRNEAVKLVNVNGEYLLRLCSDDGDKVLKLTTIQNGNELNYQINKENEVYFCDNNKIEPKKIEEMIKLQMKDVKQDENKFVYDAQQIVLKNAIQRKHWELSYKDVEIISTLGYGAFGIVAKGKLHGYKEFVAIKQSTQDNQSIFDEAFIMRNFEHANVVRFIGITLDKTPNLLVLEYCREGSLTDHLIKNPKRSNRSKLHMCLGAAAGLDHIHSKNILHCDIAARNCLYGDLQVKIADFGLSRYIEENETKSKVKKGEKLPLKYLAPETFNDNILSKKTDCWSYGILCWEIFSNGSQPFKDNPIAEVMKKASSGKFLEFPVTTPKEFLSKIIKHLFVKEEKRYSITKIFSELNGIIQKWEESENIKEKEVKQKGKKKRGG